MIKIIMMILIMIYKYINNSNNKYTNEDNNNDGNESNQNQSKHIIIISITI